MLNAVAFRLTLTLLAVAVMGGLPATAGAQEPLKLMSFNIRYGTANDGDDHWEKRRDFLVDVIRDENPDLIGLQEALHDQIQYILERLPGYASIGVGRDDGKTAGEYSNILYRTERLTVQKQETFWFSDTPDVVASTHWGNDITRICTWGRFAVRGGGTVYVYNVHLDHRSQPSREKSAELLRERIGTRDPKAPYIVMGDFNAGEQNAAVRTMTAGGFAIDTFRAKHPTATSVGTFTGFQYGRVDGEKIDHIFVSPDITVEEAAIVRTSRNDRYPSDHFPVTAVVRLPR